jgi:hypothetical protein
MSSNSDVSPTSSVTARGKAAGPNYSYSRKRWSAFDAWQEHVRKSSASADSALSARPDRDLRRAIVGG